MSSSQTISSNLDNGHYSTQSSILIPVDTSERSRDAVAWALANLYTIGDKAVLIHVSPHSGHALDNEENSYYNHSAAYDMLAGYSRYCATHDIPYESRHCVGSAQKVSLMLQAAEETNARAIVVGNHNKSLSDRLFLGSVSEALLHASSRPVVIVKSPFVVPNITSSLEGGEMLHPQRRVGIAVDESEHSRRAFDFAAANFTREGDILYVIAIRQASNKNQREGATEVKAPVGLAGLVSGEQLMETYATAIRDTGLNSDKVHLVHSITHRRPAEGFVRLASDLALDLVVVGCRGRGSMTRATLGSFSDEVLRALHVNVVVVKSPTPVAS